MSMTVEDATKVIEGHIQFLRENWKPHPDYDVIEALGMILSEFRELKEENTELHCEMQAIGANMDLLEKEIRAKAIEEFAEKMKELFKHIKVADSVIDMVVKEMKGE